MEEPVIETWEEPTSVRRISAYVRRLLIDRHHIMAKLRNPGGSVIIGNVAQKVELEATTSYSPVLGNDFHLDLLDAEGQLEGLSSDEKVRLLRWIDSLPPQVAAELSAVRPAYIEGRWRNTQKAEADDLKQSDPAGTGGEPTTGSDG